MTMRRFARALALCALAAPGLLSMTACTTPSPSNLTLEIPSNAFGANFASTQPAIPPTSSSAANYFVLPLLTTTAPIVRAIFSSPYPSELRLTVLDVTRNVTADLPQLPAGSPMPSTGAFQVRSVDAANPTSWDIVIRYPDSFQGSKQIRTFIADVVKGTTSAPLVFNMSFRGARLMVSIVSANSDGKVTSTPAGIDCPPTCSADFLASSVTVTQSVLHNQTEFTSWTGNCTGSGNSCTVPLLAPGSQPPIPANAAVTANFRIHTNTPIPAMSCPAAPLIPGKHWVTQPNCGGVLFTTLQCDSQGYFCCGAQNGTPSPRCSGQNLTTVTCSTSPIAGGPVNQELIQPGGCYVAD